MIKKEVIIGFGSNKGDRLLNLKLAVEKLRLIIYDLKLSKVYETKALGMEKGHEGDFLNMVGQGYTDLLPEELLNSFLEIEKDLGRIRENTEHYISRTIDLDILFYSNEIITTNRLIIPHPRILERNFVIIPLLDLIPDFKLLHTSQKLSETDTLKYEKEKLIVYAEKI